MPLVDAEVRVEVVGERVPRDLLPAHRAPSSARCPACGARETYASVVSRAFRCARWATCVGHHGAAAAAALGPAGHARLEEEAVDDQLTAPVEQVEQARRAVRAVEAVVLLHGHPRHPAALGGQRVAGAGQLLLLHQQLLARGVPLLRRHDRRHVHRAVSLFVRVLVRRWPARPGRRARARGAGRAARLAATTPSAATAIADGEGGPVAVGERRERVGAVRAGHGDRGQDRHAHRAADLERRVVEARGQPGVGLGHAGQRRDRARDVGGADARAEEQQGEEEVAEVAAADRHLRQQQAAEAGERHGRRPRPAARRPWWRSPAR